MSHKVKEVEESRELLSDTMKGLFPPRVEYQRRQHKLLEKLSERTGKSVKDLIEAAIDRYLQHEGAE